MLFQRLRNQTPVCSILSFLFFLCSFFIISHHAFAKKRIVVERIVAVVNSDIILWSEWRERVEAFKTRLGKTLDEDEKKKRIRQLELQLINKMIEDKLLEQNAAKLQVRVSHKEVKAAVNDTRKKHNLSKNQFREALREQGYTMVTYEVMVRRELTKLRLLQRMLRQKVSVSEGEVRKYYADMTRGVKPGPIEYRVRQIMLMFPKKSAASVVTERKRQASNILKLALIQQNLSAFGALVKKFSNGPWKDKNGDLGFLGADSLPQAIANIASKLKVNKVYPKILRSSLGFHIVFLQAKRSSGVLSYKEAKLKIKKKLQQVAFQREYRKYVKELRRKAVVVLRLSDKKSKS